MSNEWLRPRLTQPEYLTLTRLRDSIGRHAQACNGLIIDYGAGRKPYKSLFKNASRYVGVDFHVSEPGDMVLRSDGGLPFEDAIADGIVSTQVLEHVPDVSLFLSECFRVLHAGGNLVISTHGIWPYHTATGTDDFWRWTERGLREIIQKAGFVVVEVDHICGGWLSLIQQGLLLPDAKSDLMRRVGWRVYPAFCAITNVLTTFLAGSNGTRLAHGNILPVCYVVLAKKP